MPDALVRTPMGSRADDSFAASVVAQTKAHDAQRPPHLLFQICGHRTFGHAFLLLEALPFTTEDEEANTASHGTARCAPPVNATVCAGARGHRGRSV